MICFEHNGGIFIVIDFTGTLSLHARVSHVPGKPKGSTVYLQRCTFFMPNVLEIPLWEQL